MGSSSRRKSSKKKSSKLSSQARKMKKSRRNKSRKHGRRYDSSTDDSMSSHSVSSPSNSYSSNSDDDSINSKSFSTSSSKDTYRRRRSVSRSRSNVRRRRKQPRRRSSGREDSRDLSHTKKRKRSKKKGGDSKARKNSQRKKHRRDIEVFASSDSSSCSTCNGGSASDSERSEDERVRRRSGENKKDMRDSHKGKLGSTSSAWRSPSHSTYSRYRDESCSFSQSEETFMLENNSRRLRSVIIIAENPEPCTKEGNELEKDMQKEELVYDHDDYPSKSSSGEGSKNVSIPCPPNAFDGVQRVENVGFISDLLVTEPSENGKDPHKHYLVRDPSSDEFEKNNSIKESRTNVHPLDSGSSGNDLEAILKQKALENLKKFRGALETNVKPTAYLKDKDKGDLNSSSSSKAEIVQHKFPKQAGSTETQRGISDRGCTGKVSGTAEQNPDDQPNGLAQSGNPNEEGHTIRHPVLDKSVLGNSSFRETSSGVDSALKQTMSSVISTDKGQIETEISLRKTDPEIDQSMSPSISTNKGIACSSALVEAAPAEKQNLNNQTDEAKDGSQYQQKTMSVMRGGEMVQVNYKVYIPKRAPALARRQLKR